MSFTGVIILTSFANGTSMYFNYRKPPWKSLATPKVCVFHMLVDEFQSQNQKKCRPALLQKAPFSANFLVILKGFFFKKTDGFLISHLFFVQNMVMFLGFGGGPFSSSEFVAH